MECVVDWYYELARRDWQTACGPYERAMEAHDHAGLLIRTDGVARRCVEECLAALDEYGFDLKWSGAVQLARQTVHAIWGPNLAVASAERMAIAEFIYCAGPSMYVLLRERASKTEGLISCSERLSSVKGSASIASRTDASLRHRIGAADGLFTNIHCADSTVSFVREFGILFPRSTRSAILRTKVTEGRQAPHLNELYAGVPQHECTMEASLPHIASSDLPKKIKDILLYAGHVGLEDVYRIVEACESTTFQVQMSVAVALAEKTPFTSAEVANA